MGAGLVAGEPGRGCRAPGLPSCGRARGSTPRGPPPKTGIAHGLTSVGGSVLAVALRGGPPPPLGPLPPGFSLADRSFFWN